MGLPGLLSSSIGAAVAEYHQRGLERQTRISYSSGGWEAHSPGAGRSGAWREPAGFVDTCLMSSQGGQQREEASALLSLLTGTAPPHKGSVPRHLIAFLLRVRVDHELGGTQTHDP